MRLTVRLAFTLVLALPALRLLLVGFVLRLTVRLAFTLVLALPALRLLLVGWIEDRAQILSEKQRFTRRGFGARSHSHCCSPFDHSKRKSRLSNYGLHSSEVIRRQRVQAAVCRDIDKASFELLNAFLQAVLVKQFLSDLKGFPKDIGCSEVLT